MTADEFAKSVTARAASIGIVPSRTIPLDSEHAQLDLATQTDAERIRAAFSTASGIVIRIVDVPTADTANSPPSNGDEKMTLPGGENIWVNSRTVVTNDMVEDATVVKDRLSGQPGVQLRLSDEGGRRLAAATSRHVGERLVMIVDGKALIAAVIREPILGGTFDVEGMATDESANAVARSIMSHRNDLLLTIADPR